MTDLAHPDATKAMFGRRRRPTAAAIGGSSPIRPCEFTADTTIEIG